MQAITMKSTYSTYRFTLLFALILTMLGAVSYSPVLKANTKTVAKSADEKEKANQQTEHILTIGQHVLSSLSFSFESNTDYISPDIDIFHFCLPFEVVHQIVSASFQNSYLNNIFPFAISAQAP
ncbi:hypothetical protein CHU_0114 [Cytophaga hutchinsonii ATCC 33406]|uniref:Uncharacterized protein n=2 Tax=Cytophaga hutchinsonii TaxID=985 RepID=A0A6N4SMC4_CYTH3|nr:hypothetical protein CHU_0114 [Cytophaga hutchinsonii ATCC 33406]